MMDKRTDSKKTRIVMNRIILLMLFTIYYTLFTASAQSGLNVNQLFEGKIIPQEQMVETRVKGKMLSKYQLTFFRSVRFEADKSQIQRIHQLVEQDLKAAGVHSSENWSSQKSHSKETLMMQLPQKNGQNRYLSYKRKDGEVTVVYMEGPLSSLDKLKEILK